MHPEEITGSPAYANWKEYIKRTPVQITYEFPLFTDAYIVGEFTTETGPYQFLNTVPAPREGSLAPFIMLRAEYYESYKPMEPTNKTNVQGFHGGFINDEIASLLSLLLGIRLKSGYRSRRFEPGGDPKGYPTLAKHSPDPILPIATYREPVLPRVLGQRRLGDLSLFMDLPSIQPVESIALARAARNYQNAVWIAESEPELSWLLMVSAIEVAANHWRPAQEPAVERLNASSPELVKLLQEKGGDGFVQQVADLIADKLGSTKKFIDFIIEFLPKPPQDRPPEGFQIQWSKSGMKELLTTVYKLRSKALHTGIPFPPPMSMPPLHAGGRFVEKPPALAATIVGMNGRWVAKDTPLLLHTFEYIVRHSLLNWWKSLLTKNDLLNPIINRHIYNP
ncbi:MAG: hypothetical protein KA314_04585 [Chloroflexi bacterium]|nr:hypothetical protein [Chloroflexota bacterium]